MAWVRNGYPLQYSCLENPVDRGAWRATVQGVAKSWTQLSDYACEAQKWVLTEKKIFLMVIKQIIISNIIKGKLDL